ncbi:hypothetical protein A6R68_00027 [Neotoma lepida]|uniref:Uncharacterized protein n=1 Tax=Neotoma lepida TaxID=56216 RepID=A0A1A6H0U1_NEOLE|nr:hypothetical protein A6R68_00027 [Neotoma lepida]
MPQANIILRYSTSISHVGSLVEDLRYCSHCLQREQEPGLPEQEQEGGGMGQDARQIVLHVLPIEDAVDDIDGTAAFLVSQAVVRAIAEECGQEEIWPDVDHIWPDTEQVWPDVEEIWPDVEEEWYVWNSDQENQEVQEEAEDNQDYNNEDNEEEVDDDNDCDCKEEEEIEGEDEDEDQGEEIILHDCKISPVLEGPQIQE